MATGNREAGELDHADDRKTTVREAVPTTAPRPIKEVVEESGELQPAGSFYVGRLSSYVCGYAGANKTYFFQTEKNFAVKLLNDWTFRYFCFEV